MQPCGGQRRGQPTLGKERRSILGCLILLLSIQAIQQPLVVEAVPSSCTIGYALCDGGVTHQSSNKCIRVMTDHKSYSSAQNECQNAWSLLGSPSLVKIESQDVDNVVDAAIAALNLNSNNEVWIGLDDLAQEGQFVWIADDTVLDDTGFSDWQSGQPNNYESSQDCAAIDAGSLDWKDERCQDGNRYVCQRTADDCDACEVGKYKSTTSTAEGCSSCPDDSTTSSVASTVITDCLCNAGWTGPDGGTCSGCSSGTYKIVLGSSECLQCRNYSWSNERSNEYKDCECNAGYSGGDSGNCTACVPGTKKSNRANSDCDACGTGKFMNASGASACNDCPDHANSPSGSILITACICNTGYTGPDGKTCVACLAGEYKDLTGNSSCLPCRNFSLSATASDEYKDCECNAGFSGEDTGVCTACASGTFKNNRANSGCQACGAGKYMNGTGATVCTDCPGNSSSPLSSIQVIACTCNIGFTGPDGGVCTPCAPGKYKAATGDGVCTNCATSSQSPSASTAMTDCICNAGYTGPDGGPCSACAAGKYKDHPNSDVCSECEAGKYQNRTGGTHCFDCGNGSSSNAGSTNCSCNSGYYGVSCVSCDAGKYKASPGSHPCTSCQDFSTSEAASVNQSACTCNAGYSGPDGGTCVPCEVGKYKSQTGSQHCTECEPGKYQDQIGQTDCAACPASTQISAVGSTTETDCVCNAGYSGPDGGSSCSACVAGKSKAVNGSVPCSNCLAGTFSSGTANTACSDCPVDTYSTNEQSPSVFNCLSCPDNSTSAAASDAITDCLCSPGFTGPDGGDCTACLPGTSKSVTGSSNCIQCGPGTYSNQSAMSACTLCAEAKYSAATGETQERTCLDCPSGLSSEAGSIYFENCTCPRGEALRDGGTICLPCLPGTYKDTIGGTIPCRVCPIGTFNSHNGSSACTDCGVGRTTFSTARTLELECTCAAGYEMNETRQCLACRAGYHQPNVGNFSCLACVAGKFSPIAAQANCTACPANAYSETSAAVSCSGCAVNSFSDVGSDSSTDCKCEIGYAGSDGGPCSACSAGTYKATSGSAPCMNCEAGKYNPNSAQTECELCARNTYSAAGAENCQACPIGISATLQVGSSQASQCLCFVGYTGPGSTCSPCPMGTFKNVNGSQACTSCAVGAFADAVGSSVCFDCAAGKTTASMQSTAATDCACPPGYEAAASGECLPCSPGFAKAMVANTNCSVCQVGTYSQGAGQSACLTCPTNSISAVGSSANTSCICNLGFTGPLGGDCTICPTGTYKSVLGSHSCAACPSGSYQSLAGQANCSSCLRHQGSVPGSNSSSQCFCNSGYEKLSNSTCAACRAGSYKKLPGDGNCSICPEATYSKEAAASSCTLCQNGLTAPPGSTAIRDCVCVRGYTGPEGFACVPCPAGSFKNFSGNQPCELCPEGFFSGAEGAISIASCLPCPEGLASKRGSQSTSECTVVSLESAFSVSPPVCDTMGGRQISIAVREVQPEAVYLLKMGRTIAELQAVSSTLLLGHCPTSLVTGIVPGQILDAQNNTIYVFEFEYLAPSPSIYPQNVPLQGGRVQISLYQLPKTFDLSCLWKFGDANAQDQNVTLMHDRLEVRATAPPTNVSGEARISADCIGALPLVLTYRSGPVVQSAITREPCVMFQSCEVIITIANPPFWVERENDVLIRVDGLSFYSFEDVSSNVPVKELASISSSSMVLVVSLPPPQSWGSLLISVMPANVVEPFFLNQLTVNTTVEVQTGAANIVSSFPSSVPSTGGQVVEVHLTQIFQFRSLSDLQVTVAGSIASSPSILYSDLAGSAVQFTAPTLGAGIHSITVFHTQSLQTATSRIAVMPPGVAATCVAACTVSTSGGPLTVLLTGFTASSLTADIDGVQGTILNMVSADTLNVTVQIPPLPSQGPRSAKLLTVSDAAESSMLAIVTFFVQHAPAISRADFSADGSIIFVQFDQETSGQGSVQCSEMLHNLQYLGEYPSCIFESASVLSIMLGPNATIVPGQMLYFGNTTLTSIDGASTPMSAVNVVVASPSVLVSPTLTVNGPNEIGVCDSIKLLANGAAARALTYFWSCPTDPSLDALLRQVAGPIAEVAGSMLIPETIMVIVVQASNFLGATSPARTHTLTARKKPPLLLSIEVSTGVYTPQSPPFLSASPRYSKCAISKSRLSFIWLLVRFDSPGTSATVFNGTFVDFIIPKGVLEAGHQYQARLIATDSGGSAMSEVTFFVEFPPLVADIAGSSRLIRRSETALRIDGSPSYDPNICTKGRGTSAGDCTSQTLSFFWTCRSQPSESRCRRSSDSALATFATTSQILIDFTSLDLQADETVTFTLTVSKEARTGSADVSFKLSGSDVLDTSIAVTSLNANWIQLEAIASTVATPTFNWQLNGPGVDSLTQNTFIADFVPTAFSSTSFMVLLDTVAAAEHLVRGATYTITLTSTTGGDLQGQAFISFIFPIPPVGGRCEVATSQGVAIRDDFLVECSQWASDNLPIQYQFGFVPGSWDSVSAAWTPKQYANFYSLRLEAGLISLGVILSDESGGSTRLYVSTVAVEEVVSNSTQAGSLDAESEQEALLDATFTELSDLSQVSQVLQGSHGVSDSLNADSAERSGSLSRRLLASSAAYRMRVRRLMLKKMSEGVGDGMNERTASSALSSTVSLSQSPQEVVPEATDQAESMLSRFAALADPVTLRSGGLSNAVQLCNNLVLSADHIPSLDRRNRLLVSVFQNLYITAIQYLSSMTLAEGTREAIAANVSMILFRQEPNQQSLVYQYATGVTISVRFESGRRSGFSSQDRGVAIFTIASLSKYQPLEGEIVAHAAFRMPSVLNLDTRGNPSHCPVALGHCVDVKFEITSAAVNFTGVRNDLIVTGFQCAILTGDDWNVANCVTTVFRTGDTDFHVSCGCTTDGFVALLWLGVKEDAESSFLSGVPVPWKFHDQSLWFLFGFGLISALVTIGIMKVAMKRYIFMEEIGLGPDHYQELAWLSAFQGKATHSDKSFLRELDQIKFKMDMMTVTTSSDLVFPEGAGKKDTNSKTFSSFSQGKHRAMKLNEELDIEDEALLHSEAKGGISRISSSGQDSYAVRSHDWFNNEFEVEELKGHYAILRANSMGRSEPAPQATAHDGGVGNGVPNGSPDSPMLFSHPPPILLSKLEFALTPKDRLRGLSLGTRVSQSPEIASLSIEPHSPIRYSQLPQDVSHVVYWA